MRKTKTDYDTRVIYDLSALESLSVEVNSEQSQRLPDSMPAQYRAEELTESEKKALAELDAEVDTMMDSL